MFAVVVTVLVFAGTLHWALVAFPTQTVRAASDLAFRGHVRLCRAVLGPLRVRSSGDPPALALDLIPPMASLYGGSSPAPAAEVRALLARLSPAVDPELAAHVLNTCMNLLIAGGAYRDAARVGLDWPAERLAAVRAAPDGALLELNRAEALYNEGDWAGALAWLDTRLPSEGATPVMRAASGMQRAWILAHLERGEEALALATAADVEALGEAYRSEGHFARARARLAVGDLDGAERDVRAALAVACRPATRRNAELLLARIALARGDLADADARCRAARASPWTGQPGDGLLLHGDVLRGLGRHGEARAAWAEAIARDPESEAATVSRGRLAEG